MLKIFVFAIAVACSQAMIFCPPNFCDSKQCDDVTLCSGRVQTKGGVCGCCDVCLAQLGK